MTLSCPLCPPGPQYGSLEKAWGAIMTEADKVSELHQEVKNSLLNDDFEKVKNWQKDAYHKQIMGGFKEAKEAEDGFRKAQKPWAKKLKEVRGEAQHVLGHPCHLPALALGAQSGLGELGGTSLQAEGWAGGCDCYSDVLSLSSPQLETAKKAYHLACKEEKLAMTREANSKAEQSNTPEQQKKLQDKVEKCKQDVQKVRATALLWAHEASGRESQWKWPPHPFSPHSFPFSHPYTPVEE